MRTSATAPVARRPGLLIVDGNPMTRQLLRDLLAGAGFPGEEAADLGTALARVGGSKPGAVVLHDHDGDGLEILESLRSRPPDVPVVFIARPGAAETRAADARLTATARLDKPFKPSDLLATVLRAVHRPVGSGPLRTRPTPRARPSRRPAEGVRDVPVLPRERAG